LPFKPGNVTELTEKLIYFLTHPLASSQKLTQIQKISKIYNWDRICEETLRVYGEVNLFTENSKIFFHPRGGNNQSHPPGV